MKFTKILLNIFFILSFLCLILFPPLVYAAGGDDSTDFLSDDFYADTTNEAPETGDPIEPFNRAVFQLNDRAYTYVFNPIAKGGKMMRQKKDRTKKMFNNTLVNFMAVIRRNFVYAHN